MTTKKRQSDKWAVVYTKVDINITREKLYTRNEWEKALWDAFSLYIRTRDKFRCVLADEPGHRCSGNSLQAGHVIPRGKRAIKYDERQVFAQCAGSNKHHGYYPQEYTNWFIQKYGAALYNELSLLARQKTSAPTIEECKRLIKYYQDKIISIRLALRLTK
jgi:hypothetical protein